jgi:hypothetical protein
VLCMFGQNHLHIRVENIMNRLGRIPTTQNVAGESRSLNLNPLNYMVIDNFFAVYQRLLKLTWFSGLDFKDNKNQCILNPYGILTIRIPFDTHSSNK